MFILSIDFHDGVNDLKAQMKVYFLFCMPNNTYKHTKMLLNINTNAKTVIEPELRANVRFLALFKQMNAYFLVMNSKRCIIDMAKLFF